MTTAEALAARAKLLASVRGFLDAEGFVEVETPLRVRSPGMELHLQAIPAGTSRGEPRWLITSPEYHCKRALASGLPRLYAIAKCFRDGEEGGHHHPEFTMLEWYRADAGYLDVLEDTEALFREVAVAFNGEPRFHRDGRVIELASGFERMTTREAMQRYAGLDWRAHEARDDFAAAASAAGFGPIPDDDTWDDVFHRIFLTAVEPMLGVERPTAILDYPASQSALARLSPSDPGVAERFEVYAGGFELCNAFGELVDAVEQRRRFELEQRERARLHRDVYPIDEKLLAALGTLPPSAGIALGLDRLLMLATEAPELRDVLPFGFEAL